MPTLPPPEPNDRHKSDDVTTSKPRVLPVNPKGIPTKLKKRRQWVLWRYSWKAKEQKWDKPPLQVNGQPAKANDPATWTDFDSACRAYRRGLFDGIGFVPTAGDPFVFLDLDHVVGADGLEEWSPKLRAMFAGDVPSPRTVVAQLDTYAETSPSGTGVRIVCMGKLPEGRRKIGGKGNGCPDGVEMYSQAHYLTVTGQRIASSPATINECNDRLVDLWTRVFSNRKTTGTATSIPVPQSVVMEADSELLQAASGAANGDKFRRLWAGDITGCPSDSEADLALANILAFWVGPDPARIESLMRQSGLNRPKWDRHKTYLADTIKKALEGRTQFHGSDGEQAFHESVESAQPVPTGGRSIKDNAGWTDAANAARLIDKFRGEVRWVGVWDKWLIWDGSRWKIDQTLRIEEYAKQVANQLWKELAAEISQGGVDQTTMKAMYTFAKASNNVNGIRAMVALARSEPGVSIGQGELDVDPFLLNVENGTLNLRTGKLREHRREDFLMKLAPLAFDPLARCPRWRECLQTIFNRNNVLIRYMQRLVGYILTGVTEEHLLPFLYGTGANGKSTFCELLLTLLGSDYAMKAPPDLLMAKRGESHPTERADLFGKRFVACVETEEGRRMAEALVKELTGGDRVRARKMREDFWEFSPTHHIWLVGNYKPTITGTDHGIWRRIKLIPFDVTIPKEKQDKKLPAKLSAELPGILNWAVEGCLKWQQNGMQEPAIVQDATHEYSAEMDEVGQFVEEKCELDPYFIAPATELYEAFQHEMPSSHINQHSFGTSLRRRGFENKGVRTNKGKHGWKGLRLLADAERNTLDAWVAKNAEKFRSILKSKKGKT